MFNLEHRQVAWHRFLVPPTKVRFLLFQGLKSYLLGEMVNTIDLKSIPVKVVGSSPIVGI
jgi:hypothetical protein